MSKEQRLSGFMLATKPECEHFRNWSNDELAIVDKAKAGDIRPLGELLCRRLESAGARVKDAYIILHTKDEAEVWDDISLDYVSEHVEDHAHFLVIFEDRGHGLLLRDTAAAIGVDENMIEKPKRGRYAFDNMLAYLIHAKNADKHQYSPSEVVTVRGRDYKDVYRHRKADWEKGRAVKSLKDSSEDDFMLLYDKARHGEVTKAQILMDDRLFDVYSSLGNHDKIDDALDLYAARRMAKATAGMKRGDFSKVIVFAYGDAGSGKSSLFDGLCDYLERTFGWSTARLAETNSMDEYAGQEVMYLDDVQSNALKFAGWKKLLDAHNYSPAAARYHNKGTGEVGVAPRLVLILANDNMTDFFYYAPGIGGGDRSKNMDAAFRRCGLYMTFDMPTEGDPFTVGLYEPQCVEAFNWRYSGSAKDAGATLTLEWYQRQVVAGRTYTPYGAAYEVLNRLDEASNGRLLEGHDDNEVRASLASAVRNRRLRAERSGMLPALPEPTSEDGWFADDSEYGTPEGMPCPPSLPAVAESLVGLLTIGEDANLSELLGYEQ